jgi:hypothetical protein
MRIGKWIIVREKDLERVYSEVADALHEIHFYWWAEELGYNCEEAINITEHKLRNIMHELAKILFGKKAELLDKFSCGKKVGKHDMDKE